MFPFAPAWTLVVALAIEASLAWAFLGLVPIAGLALAGVLAMGFLLLRRKDQMGTVVA